MKKIFGLIAAAAFVGFAGFAGFASAADAPSTDAAKAKELTQVEMDAVSAGLSEGGTTTTTITSLVRKIGRTTYILTSSGWVRQ